MTTERATMFRAPVQAWARFVVTTAFRDTSRPHFEARSAMPAAQGRHPACSRAVRMRATAGLVVGYIWFEVNRSTRHPASAQRVCFSTSRCHWARSVR